MASCSIKRNIRKIVSDQQTAPEKMYFDPVFQSSDKSPLSPIYEAPVHQWSLLRHLPCLKQLTITDCSDLTCISTDLLQCISSLKILTVKDCKNGTVSLLERLGDLTSLTQLVLCDCSGIKSLPESIQQLTRLQRLKINGCPGLVQWCESEENMMMLALIKEIVCALPIYPL